METETKTVYHNVGHTKRVEYFVDCFPNWQDGGFPPCLFSIGQGSYLPELSPGTIRVRVIVDLPCVGGSALATDTLVAEVKHDPSGT